VCAALEHDDPSGLLDDVEAARLAGRGCRVHRCIGVRNAHEVQLSSFGEDAAGELYLMSADSGAVYRLAG
jgi:hypothetical protein